MGQLVSPAPEFICQMTRKLTIKRYKYTTIFVDQPSKIGYIYLQKTNIAIETLEAKVAFQQHNMDKCVVIKAYHADNTIFKSNE